MCITIYIFLEARRASSLTAVYVEEIHFHERRPADGGLDLTGDKFARSGNGGGILHCDPMSEVIPLLMEWEGAYVKGTKETLESWKTQVVWVEAIPTGRYYDSAMPVLFIFSCT